MNHPKSRIRKEPEKTEFVSDFLSEASSQSEDESAVTSSGAVVMEGASDGRVLGYHLSLHYRNLGMLRFFCTERWGQEVYLRWGQELYLILVHGSLLTF